MVNDCSLTVMLQEIEQSTFSAENDAVVAASTMPDDYRRGTMSLRKPKGSGDDSLSKGLA